MLISGTRSQFNLLVVNLIDRQALCSICKALMLSLSTLSSFDCGSLVVICALQLVGYCQQNKFENDRCSSQNNKMEIWKDDKRVSCLGICAVFSAFRGETDTPILDFWWRLPQVSKPGWISHLHTFFPASYSSESPLVRHLLTLLRSAWQPSLFNPQISVSCSRESKQIPHH